MQKLLHLTITKSFVIVGAVLALSACTSNTMPTMAQFEPQYCHTKSKYTLKNGNKANSRVDVNCTDNPKDKHFLAYSGMAKDCREHYYEIFLNCSVEDCSKRDYKGNYQKALSGELDNFIGISEPYEVSDSFDLVVDSGRCSVEDCSQKILTSVLDFINKK